MGDVNFIDIATRYETTFNILDDSDDVFGASVAILWAIENLFKHYIYIKEDWYRYHLRDYKKIQTHSLMTLETKLGSPYISPEVSGLIRKHSELYYCARYPSTIYREITRKDLEELVDIYYTLVGLNDKYDKSNIHQTTKFA